MILKNKYKKRAVKTALFLYLIIINQLFMY